jgi:hypothetical protein
MKIKNIFISILIISITITPFKAQKLKSFGSSISKVVAGKTIRTPYTQVISYLGYAEPGSEDEIVNGKKFSYIYLWVPAIAPEIGVRMMSPVGNTKISKKAIKAKNYDDNSSSKEYFDTYITLERSPIKSKDDINEENVKSTSWTTLARNDDSGEMPTQPSGSNYNSLLRHKSVASDPKKALTVGLYRIGFTTYKVGEVKGTFIAEVGAPIKLPGSAIAKTIEELVELLNK